MDCLFCQIVNGDSSADIVYQDETVLAFRDIHPKAPIHILVIPKKHIGSLAETGQSDQFLLGQLLGAVSQLAKDNGLDGYKTVINTGKDGGQVIDHLHLHLLGGRKFSE